MAPFSRENYRVTDYLQFGLKPVINLDMDRILFDPPTLSPNSSSPSPCLPLLLRHRGRPLLHRLLQISIKTASILKSNGLYKNSAARASASLLSRSQRISLRASGFHYKAHLALNFIHRNYIDDNKVAIVCSARSGSTKALGTTNLLLRAASEALKRTKPASASASGAATPVSRGLFGAGSYGSDNSQSPPTSPKVRSRSSRSSSPTPLFGFTPINGNSNGESQPDFSITVDIIRNEHVAAARVSINDPHLLKELEDEIERDCEWLRNFLLAAKVCSF